MPCDALRCIRATLAILALIGIGAGPTGPHLGLTLSAQDTSEYALKAAFLYNFALYTEWPDTPSIYRMCIFGKDPFGSAMDAIGRKEIGGRAIEVRRLNSIEETANCELLFVTSAEQGRLPQINNLLAGRAIVVVAESGNYDPQLVILRLEQEQGRLVFDANQTHAKTHRLTLGAKLLRLARTVY